MKNIEYKKYYDNEIHFGDLVEYDLVENFEIGDIFYVEDPLFDTYHGIILAKTYEKGDNIFNWTTNVPYYQILTLETGDIFETALISVKGRTITFVA